jgi:transposase
MTDVTTTPAPVLDLTMLPTIQAHLAARNLAPQEHLVDSGSMPGDQFRPRRHASPIDVIGPASTHRSWHAQAGNGVGAAQGVIAGAARQATCPHGKTRAVWVERENRHGQAAIQIWCAKKACAACAVRARCSTAVTQGRAILLRHGDHALALHQARQRQHTPAWKTAYARRAGREGTIGTPVGNGVRIGDLRRSRDRGFAKTRLRPCVIAAALNVLRVGAWVCDTPRSHTRPAAFAALARTG